MECAAAKRAACLVEVAPPGVGRAGVVERQQRIEELDDAALEQPSRHHQRHRQDGKQLQVAAGVLHWKKQMVQCGTLHVYLNIETGEHPHSALAIGRHSNGPSTVVLIEGATLYNRLTWRQLKYEYRSLPFSSPRF